MVDLASFPFRTVLVTGGTGTFGNACAEYLLRYTSNTKIRIYSRDEVKQGAMREKYGAERLSFLLGDVRDLGRLQRAMRGVDLVLHAAALKQVPAGEYNPDEFVKTNIIGSMNVIETAVAEGVKKVVMLSTDKACAPVNLYGASKMAAERLFIGANHYANKTILCVTRYGNVMGSRGSVVEFFRHKLANGEALPVTSTKATRFWMHIAEAVDLVLTAAVHAKSGEIFVPNLPAFNLIDLVEVMVEDSGSSSDIEVVGLRPGEKEHESLMTDIELGLAVQRDGIFVVRPESLGGVTRKPIDGLSLYRSDVWRPRLSKDDIRARLALV